MLTNPKEVINKKPDFKKLISYGFVKDGEKYVFSSDILDGTFLVSIYVFENGVTKVSVIDKAIGEEYALAYVPSSSFVMERFFLL